MAFSNSSYFAGVGTVFAAITLGFAGGAMVTKSAVQPPNRLERVSAPLSSSPPPGPIAEQASVAKPPSQEPPPVSTAAAAVPAPASDPQPVQQPPAARPVMAKGEDAAMPNVQQPPPAPPITARSEDASAGKNERANTGSAELKREVYRKRGEDRKSAERKRRQDTDDAANAVRPMRRDGVIDQVVESDDAPRFGDEPPRRFGLFGSDNDAPRYRDEPPRHGLFGNN